MSEKLTEMNVAPSRVFWILARHWHWWCAAKFFWGWYVMGYPFEIEEGKRTKVRFEE